MLTVLLVGDKRWAEFQAALESPIPSTWRSAPTPSDAIQMLADRAIAPDVIILAQRYPGEFRLDDVDHLRQLCPLVRFVGLLGSWCEGEMRTGRPWPGVFRAYWHQWISSGPRHLASLAAGRSLCWSLPATATEEERLLADAGSRLPLHGRVTVVGSDETMVDLLKGACADRGLECVGPGSVDLALYDVRQLGPNELVHLRELIEAVAPAPVAVVANFPRLDEVRAALDAGASIVFSKPLDLCDLDAWLDRLAGL